MNLEIGNKSLKDLTKEDLYQIVLIEQCCNGLEYWDKPIIVDFDNTTFSDTYVLDYYSLRTDDRIKGKLYCFYFNFSDFRFHYSYEPNLKEIAGSNRVGLKTLIYLIEQGYDVPIYNIKKIQDI